MSSKQRAGQWTCPLFWPFLFYFIPTPNLHACAEIFLFVYKSESFCCEVLDIGRKNGIIKIGKCVWLVIYEVEHAI